MRRGFLTLALAVILLASVALIMALTPPGPGEDATGAMTNETVGTPAAPSVGLTGSPDAPHVDGFHLELGRERPHRVALDPVPLVFATHPRATEVPGVQTPHGINAGGALAQGIGAQFPVRDAARGLLGGKSAFVIGDGLGNPLAYWLGSPSLSPGEPGRFAIEGVRRGPAGRAVVEGPEQAFADRDGIQYFRPVVVAIRGYPGVLLTEQTTAVTLAHAPHVRAVTTLVWSEGEMYWRLSAWDPPGETYYTPAMLLEIAANDLVQWDHGAQTWQPVR